MTSLPVCPRTIRRGTHEPSGPCSSLSRLRDCLVEQMRRDTPVWRMYPDIRSNRYCARPTLGAQPVFRQWIDQMVRMMPTRLMANSLRRDPTNLPASRHMPLIPWAQTECRSLASYTLSTVTPFYNTLYLPCAGSAATYTVLWTSLHLFNDRYGSCDLQIDY